jgi:hypothetical protein
MKHLRSREPIPCWEALGLPIAPRCLSIALTSDVAVPFPFLSGLLACSAVQNAYVGDQGVASATAAVCEGGSRSLIPGGARRQLPPEAPHRVLARPLLGPRVALAGSW